MMCRFSDRVQPLQQENTMLIHVVTAYLFLNSAVNGIEWGRCPSYSVQQDFKIQQYLGKWYQYGSINTYFQGNGRCIYAVYNETEDSNIINVHNQQTIIKTNKTSFVDGFAVLENPSSNEGKLIVTLYPKWWFKVSGNYWVLSTDYSTYAIVYSCSSWFWIFHSSTYWILTRDQILSNDILSTIKKALEAENLTYSDFILANQSNCN